MSSNPSSRATSTRIVLDDSGLTLNLDPSGIESAVLRDRSVALATIGEPAIKVIPSLVDPKVIIAKWDHREGVRYFLVIVDLSGNVLYKSTESFAGSQMIPISALESFIGQRAKAILVWMDTASDTQGVGPEVYFVVPRPAQPYVWNYDSQREKWVKQRVGRAYRETILLVILMAAIAAFLYNAARTMPNFHL